MKIVFVLHLLFDTGLEYFRALAKTVDIELVIHIHGEITNQSIITSPTNDISVGFHRDSQSKLVERLTSVVPEIKKCNVLKYNSNSFKDRINFTVSYNFCKWIRREKFTHVFYYGSSAVWLQQLPFLVGLSRVFFVHDYLPHSGRGENIDYKTIINKDNLVKVQIGQGKKTKKYPPYKLYMGVITLIPSHYFVLFSNNMSKKFSTYYRVPEHRVIVSKFGYLTLFRDSSIKLLPKERSTILFFGRISEYKGIEYLIQAALLLKDKIYDLKVIIAGTGLFQYDKSEVKNNQIFELLEYHIPNSKLIELFSRASIVICPYIDATQSGVVVTSYAFGKPVIGTRLGAFEEYIKDGETGLLVDPANAGALANAIEYCLTHPDVIQSYENKIKEYEHTLSNWETQAELIVGRLRSKNFTNYSWQNLE